MTSIAAAEGRSIAFHRAIAERLRDDPQLVASARRRIHAWLEAEKIHPRYAARWFDLLSLPIDQVCDALVDDSEEMCALRKSTPFVGVLDAKTRWRIWREQRPA